jgi:tetratricopeptide (TPR) repeat protein
VESGFSRGPERELLAFSVRRVALFAVGLLVASSIACRDSERRASTSLPPTSVGEASPGERPEGDPGGEPRLRILSPLDGTLFPPEIAPPTFQWEQSDEGPDTWLVRITFSDGKEPITDVCRSAEWTPSAAQWEAIKSRSREKTAHVTIEGTRHADPERVLAKGSISISTSDDEVGAPIFYREVHLPFLETVKSPATYIRWRFGDVSSTEQPPVVLEGLPNCANCHSFTADGATLAMEVDSANDKGSYVIAPVGEEIVFDKSRIMTWSDYRREDNEPTFGLLAQISPDGRYVVCMVKDRSVFVPKPGLEFSQLFFPIQGILVYYDRRTKQFGALPGADDPAMVQANPAWSPDGKSIVFARHEVYHLRNLRNKNAVLLSPDECREFLEEGKLFQYDLYRIPFNDGKGGTPEPLKGASANGMSNYFAKYSPDGKWIVFCKAKSFMLLQPDSELYIIPASGGEARRLRANTSRMNSWHSWSPNGRWLVFSSKANAAFTQLFLTHIDEAGRSSPAVLLSHFTTATSAANIPEFVNTRPGAIKRIREEFLDDRSYARAGYIKLILRDLDGAERAFRRALELNPENANAHYNMATILIEKKRLDEAASHCREALRIDPEAFEAHLNLGRILVDKGELDEGIKHLSEAIRLRPQDPLAEYHLGLAREKQGNEGAAVQHYVRAIENRPELVPAILSLASIRATTRYYELRNGENAVELAKKGCELTKYTDPWALDVLAAADAEAGQFSEALRIGSMAIQLARAAGNEQRATVVEQRVDLYRQGKPFRRSAPFDP